MFDNASLTLYLDQIQLKYKNNIDVNIQIVYSLCLPHLLLDAAVPNRCCAFSEKLAEVCSLLEGRRLTEDHLDKI